MSKALANRKKKEFLTLCSYHGIFQSRFDKAKMLVKEFNNFGLNYLILADDLEIQG